MKSCLSFSTDVRLADSISVSIYKINQDGALRIKNSIRDKMDQYIENVFILEELTDITKSALGTKIDAVIVCYDVYNQHIRYKEGAFRKIDILHIEFLESAIDSDIPIYHSHAYFDAKYGTGEKIVTREDRDKIYRMLESKDTNSKTLAAEMILSLPIRSNFENNKKMFLLTEYKGKKQEDYNKFVYGWFNKLERAGALMDET